MCITGSKTGDVAKVFLVIAAHGYTIRVIYGNARLIYGNVYIVRALLAPALSGPAANDSGAAAGQLPH